MYYIFNKEGELIATCDLEPNLEDLASREEQAVETEQHFTNPLLVEGKIVERGEQPSSYHEWDGKAWMISADKEVELKTAQQSQMWEQIKAKREAHGRKGCFVQSVDKWFHTDDHSRQQYIFMRTLTKIPPKTMWKTMDNSFVEMTKALLDELSFAMFSQEQADFTNAEKHRVAMLKVANPLDYDYSTGWSDIYAE